MLNLRCLTCIAYMLLNFSSKGKSMHKNLRGKSRTDKHFTLYCTGINGIDHCGMLKKVGPRY